MTTKIQIFIILTLFPFAVNAQWTQIDSPTTTTLNDVYFPSEQIGFAVGGHPYNGNGIILKTINGGMTWSVIDSIQIDFTFEKVFFVDENIGFATGHNVISALLYKTSNGGINWEISTIPLTSAITDIGMIAENLFLIQNSSMFKSSDLGENWTLTSHIETDILDYVSFIDTVNGFGHIQQAGFVAIYKTQDAGSNWQKIEFTSNIMSTQQEAFVFVDSLLGFSGGWYEQHLMQTIDGGQTWQELNISDGTMPFIEFISIKDSVVYTGGANGLIYRSDDLGANWISQPLPATVNFNNVYGLNKIFIINDSTALGVGFNGTIIRTSNSGGALGINENNLKKRINIFPNPSSNQVKIEMDEGISIRQMELMETNGKVVNSYPIQLTELDLSGLSAGIYILKIMTDQGVVSKRVVVE